jgi:hypothetical protein
MIAAIATLALSAVFQEASATNPCANGYTQNIWDPRFTPGQRWSYRARPIDKDSTLTVLKIDFVPDIGTVVHITVNHVDFDDKPGDPARNNTRLEQFAIRRDSLDASVLDVLGISQVAGPPNYYSWQNNCGGLTHATTVADTIKTLQETYLARQETFTTPIALIPEDSTKAEKLSITLSQNMINDPLRQLKGQISFKNGGPVKDALVEITSYDFNRTSNTMHLKTDKEGRFSIALPRGTYDFKLTLDGFRTVIGTLSVSLKQSALVHILSGN